jgi:prolyl-tRNA editing enzyme YbaK/EbsC (Cys-tRNA(Pro) deacylase)
VLVTRGDARLDNKKVKAAFGAKPRLLEAAETEALTGHPVGGVCPFGLATPLPVYCDVSLKAFDIVIPAAGATNSAVRIAPDRMATITGATWIDLCQTA